MERISTLAWLTKNHPASLSLSIESFQKEAARVGRKFEFKVFSQSTDLSSLKAAAKKAGIDPLLVDFATRGAFDGISPSVVNTGANRNLYLLSLPNRCFLSIDDDALLLPGPYPFTDYRYDTRPDPLRTRYLGERESLFRETTEQNKGVDFFELHERALSAGKEFRVPVPVSVSGIVGDSGTATPRLLFSLSDEQIVEVTRQPGLFQKALTNRLVHRQAESALLSPQPVLMMPCVAFNNHILLPPFFPMGRNQDGAYAYLLKACVPGSVLGHIPASIFHQPDVPRSYPQDILNKMDFRFNDLLILLLVEYLKNPTRDLNTYFCQFAQWKEPDFFSHVRNLYGDAADRRSQAIQSRITRLSSIKTPDMKTWIQYAHAEVALSQSIQKNPGFGVPVECTVARAQEWLGLFGQLLGVWPELKRISAQIDPNALHFERSHGHLRLPNGTSLEGKST